MHITQDELLSELVEIQQKACWLTKIWLESAYQSAGIENIATKIKMAKDAAQAAESMTNSVKTYLVLRESLKAQTEAEQNKGL